MDRAKKICEPQYLDEELRHLDQALRAKGDSVGEVRRSVRQRRTARPVASVSQENVDFAVLPYVHGAVSYTHLDVYKRQIYYNFLTYTIYIYFKK